MKNAIMLTMTIILSISCLSAQNLDPVHAQQPHQLNTQQIFAERMELYHGMSLISGIPWYYLAALDQYERILATANPKDRPAEKNAIIAVYFTPADWSGLANPNQEDSDPRTISLFGGAGLDGDGDGKAERNNSIDALHTMISRVFKYGTQEDDLLKSIWQHYKNHRSVKRVQQFARLYQHFGTLDLHKKAFPVPLRADYSYRSTWGAGRSYGGYRIHEGTDLFVGYGVPVRSTSYGIIEVMGWNRFGGWRIGIRDINSVYHYYAHLSGYNKEQIKQGDIVKPGDIIGWVGSSGYGKPGTQGKFPPHLHFGMYRDNGYMEWSFDPYPYLRRWEQAERKAGK